MRSSETPLEYMLTALNSLRDGRLHFCVGEDERKAAREQHAAAVELLWKIDTGKENPAK